MQHLHHAERNSQTGAVINTATQPDTWLQFLTITLSSTQSAQMRLNVAPHNMANVNTSKFDQIKLLNGGVNTFTTKSDSLGPGSTIGELAIRPAITECYSALS
jgi:hypothetical protein